MLLEKFHSTLRQHHNLWHPTAKRGCHDEGSIQSMLPFSNLDEHHVSNVACVQC
jgi:hypothetical protein